MGENFTYISTGGSSVTIPSILDPFKELGVSSQCGLWDAKAGFRANIVSHDRRKRALISLSYDMILKRLDNKHIGRYIIMEENKMKVIKPDHFFYALIGDCKELSKMCSQNPKLLDEKDERQCTMLYISAHSGWMDMTTMLLKVLKGNDQLNATMDVQSSALHAASFYRQGPVVQLLLEHGVDPDMINNINMGIGQLMKQHQK